MKNKIYYDNLFIYSYEDKTFFNAEFIKGINIIHGPNTSGKSTIIQLIFYALGINEYNEELKPLLQKKILVRLDFTLSNNKYTIIRYDETIKFKDKYTKPFHGINGNNSRVHNKLKKHLSTIFNFDLQTNNKTEYDQAPIESFFLPYYIAQDVGWTSLHKSFKQLQYIRKFKKDYLDYFLGIETTENKTERVKIENDLNIFRNERNFIKRQISEDGDYQIALLQDEECSTKAIEYLASISNKKEELIKKEKTLIKHQSQIIIAQEKLKTLKSIRTDLKKQDPRHQRCTECKQLIQLSNEHLYEYLQDVNDTQKNIDQLTEQTITLKEITSKSITTSNSIKTLREEIEEDYQILKQYNVNNVTMDDWLEHKIILKNHQKMKNELSSIQQKIEELEEKYKKLNDQKLEKRREKKINNFRSEFIEKLTEVELNIPKEKDNTNIYKLYTPPYQGVELLKSILAFSFSFINEINKNNFTTPPLMLDAIFKEDFDSANRKTVLNFIFNNSNKSHQSIITIADLNNTHKPEKITNELSNLDNQEVITNFICIGDNHKQRAILKEFDSSYNDLLNDTIEIFTT